MSVTINGSSGVTTNSGAVYNGLQTGTAIASTSGTSIDFTSIPSWVKRVTVMFQGVSTSGTSNPGIRLGTSSGVETTNYVGSTSQLSTVVVSANSTAGWFFNSAAAANSLSGSIIISLIDPATNTWACQGIVSYPNVTVTISGSKSLSGVLDRIRITTVNGTDTFDAGSINIIYE